MKRRPVRSSVEAVHLFDKAWKPGFLTDDSQIVAVKCRRVASPSSATSRENSWDGTTLRAFPDGSSHTRACFEKSVRSARPARVAVWEDGDYVDVGWAIPTGTDDTGKYVFDASEEVQARFASLPYPKTPLPEHTCSQRTDYEGFVYDSRLEATVAALFDELGIRYERQPPSVATHAEAEWRTDFEIVGGAGVVLSDQSVWTGSAYAEVKPTYPSLDEMRRCVCLTSQTRKPVLLLYGKVAPPWRLSPSHASAGNGGGDGGGGAYARHSLGLMGMVWEREGRRVVRREVVLKEEDGNILFDSVHDHCSDLGWATPRLTRAYDHASRRVARTEGE